MKRNIKRLMSHAIRGSFLSAALGVLLFGFNPPLQAACTVNNDCVADCYGSKNRTGPQDGSGKKNGGGKGTGAKDGSCKSSKKGGGAKTGTGAKDGSCKS
ncbi:MAG: hypothetical protein ACOYM3_35090 [Terrimicrobiaceae bacterium]